LVLGLFQFLVDAVAMVCASILMAIGIGYLIVIGRFCYDQLRGVRDPEAPAIPDTDLPRVVLQIPVFNEPLVTEQSLRCVALLDWPKDRLRIQLLDDSTDETSARADAVAAELRIGGAVIDHVRRADRSGFKAGACAHGLTLTDEPFIAMLELEGEGWANFEYAGTIHSAKNYGAFRMFHIRTKYRPPMLVCSLN
jgi:cellulose synthase/poly-beta-1,6-N-acetylglucosamine synthase-like glycosyltransferase